jgi:hypothetical protein
MKIPKLEAQIYKTQKNSPNFFRANSYKGAHLDSRPDRSIKLTAVKSAMVPLVAEGPASCRGHIHNCAVEGIP